MKIVFSHSNSLVSLMSTCVHAQIFLVAARLFDRF